MDAVEILCLLAGRYEVHKLLASGKMSRVYLGRDRKQDKTVIIKCPQSRDAGKREASYLRAARGIIFPHLEGVAEVNGQVYLIMEYIEGASLQQVLARGKVKKRTMLVWMRQIAAGILSLHEMDPPVLYCDVKPDNILITEKGQVRILDLGAARQKEQSGIGYTFGSPGYAAPEQYGDRQGKENKQIDERSDVYGLGGLLFYLYTGVKPCSGIYDKLRTKTYKIINRRIRKLLLKSLCPERGQRYKSVKEFLCDLDKVLARRRYIYASAAVLLLGLAGWEEVGQVVEQNPEPAAVQEYDIWNYLANAEEAEVRKILEFFEDYLEINSEMKAEMKIEGYLALARLWRTWSEPNMRVLEKANSIIGSLENGENKKDTWLQEVCRQLMEGYRNEGHLSKALSYGEILLRMQEQGVQVDSQMLVLCDLAELYAGLGQHRRAEEIFEKAVQAGEDLPEVLIRYLTYLCANQSEANVGQAADIYQQCLEIPEAVQDIRFQKLAQRIVNKLEQNVD